jgi:hypothetical protein
MTFLELVQDFMREAGMSGSIVSVQGQVGEAQRAVNWIIKGCRSIQLEHPDWEFLRADVTFNTTVPNNRYTAAAAGVANFGEWRFRGDDWRCYTAATGVMDEQPVRFEPYADFRRNYMYGANRLSSGRPTVVTQAPDMSLMFWPTPDAAYTIVGEQFQAPVDLVNNSDAPPFAARFHGVIVYRALMLYGEFEGDQSVLAYAQGECDKILAKMESVYLPQWEAAGPLA